MSLLLLMFLMLSIPSAIVIIFGSIYLAYYMIQDIKDDWKSRK